MPHPLRRLLDDGPATLRARIAAICVVLALANAAAWAWALVAFRHAPVLLGTALLAYGLGLRHAVDADHIAAIDNVTRRLMQDGRRPVAVGFFFALGHSAVVVLASAAIALAATGLGTRLDALRSLCGTLGTLVSAASLLAVALMNLPALHAAWATFQRAKAGRRDAGEDVARRTAGGPLSRLLRPLFATMGRSWHMAPLGLLFCLGFDTATEVGLLGISATQAGGGLPTWSIMVFPALFAAAMALVDTADGILMLGTYGWAFTRPIRRTYYDMTVTAASIAVALLVAAIETLGLLGDRLALHGRVWDAVGALNDNGGSLGAAIVAGLAASWLVSAVIYRVKGYDRLGLDA